MHIFSWFSILTTLLQKDIKCFSVNLFWSLVMSQSSKILQSSHKFLILHSILLLGVEIISWGLFFSKTFLFIFWKLHNLHFSVTSHLPPYPLPTPHKENSDSYGSRRSVMALEWEHQWQRGESSASQQQWFLNLFQFPFSFFKWKLSSSPITEADTTEASLVEGRKQSPSSRTLLLTS